MSGTMMISATITATAAMTTVIGIMIGKTTLGGGKTATA
jgi:hypothetical protein